MLTDIPVPIITGFTDAEKLAAVIAYLTQLYNSLTRELASIDLTNLSPDLAEKINKSLNEHQDLSAYATKSYVGKEMNSYVDSKLESYVTQSSFESELNNYAKESDLEDYVTQRDFDREVADCAKTSDLDDYVTDSALNTTLNDYVKQSQIEDYATEAWVNTNFVGK